MPRYFLEVAYKGTNYNGFQIQQNANTIQAEVEKALQTLFKESFELTGSSRTDAGVHALQNFFHFDTHIEIASNKIYNLNAILPNDIIAKSIYKVASDKHCRFAAEGREYKYFIYTKKNPFLQDRAYFFPYTLNTNLLHEAAAILLTHTDFTSFSKKHTQVNNFNCNISIAKWIVENDCLVFNVKANRFLRGMVRALVATMLKVGRGQISIEDFKQIIAAKDCSKAYFDTPAHGLFLVKVDYE
ncbi:MAG: tRNA pseudouridine(38-40) synthase TruA, partial [Chitinophagaceae bacterium]